MKSPKLFILRRPFAGLCFASLFTALAATSATAATSTWTGGGTNPSWNQAANWGGVGYSNGDDAIFGDAARPANYIASGKTTKSITFTSDAPAYTIGLTSNNSTSPDPRAFTFIGSNTGITIEAGNDANHSIGRNVNNAAGGSITLNGSLPITHLGTGVLSLTSSITGGHGIVKNGSGTLVLTENNTYSGDTTINAGTLQGLTRGGSANSNVILNEADATFSIQVNDNSQSWTCADFTVTQAGTLEFDFAAVTPSLSVAPLAITTNGTSGGEADFAATPAINVIVNSGLVPGSYPLITWDSASGTIPSDVTVSELLENTTASLSADDETLYLVITSTVVGIVKADNTDDLNLGSSWVDGAAPTASDLATWDSTVTTANSTVLGADAEWGSIVINDPAGPVTIGAGNTLTLTPGFSQIDMSLATADLTLNCDVALGGANSWTIASGRTLALGGMVSGDFPLTLSGGGNVRLDASDILSNVDATVTVDANLDLNGNSETFGSLSGSGSIDNTSTGTASTLVVGGNNANSTFNGVIQNSDGSSTIDLVKVGTGTLNLGGANTFSGPISVEGGNLALGNTTPIDNVSGITMASGTQLRPTVPNVALSAPITIAGDATFTAPAFGVAGDGGNVYTANLNSPISGIGNVTLLGYQAFNTFGTINLGAASDYEGDTLIDCLGTNSNIYVNLGIENALPTSTVLTLDGQDGAGVGRFCYLNLNGFDQTVAGLQNVPRNNRQQRIWNNATETSATLTVNNTENFTYSGILRAGNGELGLTKSGLGTLTLASSNTYTGRTIITGGTLALGATDAVSEDSFMILGNATLATGSGSANSLEALEIDGDATINIGSGALLEFGFSAFEPWNGSLTITGNFESGSSLRFGNNAGGLSANQLALISGPGLSDIALDGDGFLTATVEIANYTAWANANVGGQSPDQDFDGDGVANGIEYFLNAPAGFTALPTLDATNTITWTNGGNIPASEYGTQFVVQTSGNLVDWTDVPAGELDANADGPDGALSYTLSGLAPRFIRLSVTPTL